MSPETVKRLTESVPELQELISFIKSEIAALDTLAGIEELTREGSEIALEVLARLRAKQTLEAILAPLINTPDALLGTDPQDYVV